MRAFEFSPTGPDYAYTDAGRLQSRNWARGTTTAYDYSDAGDLTGVSYNDGTAAVAIGLDPRGRPSAVTNGANITVYAFSDAGTLLVESHTAGVLSGFTVTNSLDELQRRTNVTVLSSPSSVLTASGYSYDYAARLATVDDGVNSATYSYLANSPLVDNVVFKQGYTVQLTRNNQFDALNRLTNLVWTAGAETVASFAYQYNDANQRTRATLADGCYWIYQYDFLGQVTNAVKHWSDGTLVAGQQSAYEFDDIGNRKSSASGGDSSGANPRSATYGANLLNQYTNRTVPGFVEILGEATNAATVTVWSEEGLFTTAGYGDYFRAELSVSNASPKWLAITNIAVLQQGTNADIVATNIGNIFVPQADEAFAHDLDGNLTNDGRWSYVWDAENRATSFTRIGSAPSGAKVKLDYAYDYRWRRTQKIVSAWNGSDYAAQSTNKFIYDGWNLLAILDGTNGLFLSFTWGLDASGTMQGAGGVGGLISMTVHQGTNAGTYFYCFDGNHNVAALVNASNGVVAARYECDAFGRVLRATGALALVNPFVFSTKFCDWETGFYYYGYRYYDPSTGRWPTRDPVGERGGMNLFGFVGNNPVATIDMLGLTGGSGGTIGMGTSSYWEIMKWIGSVEVGGSVVPLCPNPLIPDPIAEPMSPPQSQIRPLPQPTPTPQPKANPRPLPEPQMVPNPKSQPRNRKCLCKVSRVPQSGGDARHNDYASSLQAGLRLEFLVVTPGGLSARYDAAVPIGAEAKVYEAKTRHEFMINPFVDPVILLSLDEQFTRESEVANICGYKFVIAVDNLTGREGIKQHFPGFNVQYIPFISQSNP